ncbi:hypothetical protein I302_106669 [Kwoniella bestiolae CBS 10118]|uniref:Uncharacterized protein n=1 Tax=Kwoniella bestiolae CBS 10118 TaxID=1296100 RepID=A0A1B9G0S3_9TREE|nr:hypothetical protein I302_06069 [Kwoniella bestiolae CBS 10118]OCF24608.1 hypothetical protein I302_06069 [Kwoniella bestiolae CBS 10118]
MLRTNGSNEYIDAGQVEGMIPLLGEFWNSSISWTQGKGSWMELSFVGTDIWTYGMIGPSYSSIEFVLDDESMGTFPKEQEVTDYHHLLFEQHGLEDIEHTLKMVNVEGEGRRMSFDYAIIQSERMFQSPDSHTESTTEIPVPGSTKSSQNATSLPTPAGIQSISSLTNTPALAAQMTSSISESTPSETNNTTLATSSESSSNSSPAMAQTQASASASASAAALAAASLPPQYSLAQLASLKEIYKFHWNAASYFVVIFASIVVLAFLLCVIHTSLKLWIKNNAHGSVQGADPEVGDKPPREERYSGILDTIKLRIGSTMNPRNNGDTF